MLVQCTECSMIFVPDSDALFTEAKFYQTEGSAFYSSEDKLSGDYSPVRYAREIRILRKFCQRGRILDVGCSTGGFLYFLREQFPSEYDVLGNDVATGALEVAEAKGVPVSKSSFFELPADGGFEAITFWAVLEHVADPGAFLRKARELLKPGGRCFVLVPNIRSLAVKMLGANYRYILPQHINYFSPGTLRRLIESCGLEVVDETTTHFNPAVILKDFRSGGGFVEDRERARLLVKTNALKTKRWLAPVRWLYRCAESVLGAAKLADNVVIVAERKQ